MSPPAFRHSLVERARRAGKRIVLPEGDDPRTIEAAAICQQRGIAHCVLLGNPQRIGSVAAAHGLSLPADLQIIDLERKVQASEQVPGRDNATGQHA